MDKSVEETVKETIIIVHGTWAGLEAGKYRWYQAVEVIDAAQPFTAKLDAALKERGSPARCWAHCIKSDQIFHWSPGANDWVARTRAAAALADYVANIQNKGWVCHLIGHSHGGNVALEAATSNEPLGKLVTLGTPFLDTMSPIRKSAQRRRRVISTICVVGGLLVLSVAELFWWDTDWKKVALLYGAFSSMTFGLVLIDWFIRRRARNEINEVRAFLSSFSQTPQFHTPLLAIGSPMDEAWQVLHHLGAIPNPLAIRSGPLRYLFSSLQSQMSRDAARAQIQGAKSFADVGLTPKLWVCLLYVLIFMTVTMVVFLVKGYPKTDLFGTCREIADSFYQQHFSEIVLQYPESAKELPDASQIARWLFLFFVLEPLGVSGLFLNRAYVIGPKFYSAFLSPFRWCFRLLSALINLFPEIGTYIVRRQGWSVLLKMTMGLEGYRFPIPRVEQFPRNVSETFVKYEDMPKGAQQRAMDKRTAWIARHLGDVSQTFAKMVITAADISTLLRTIEEDQSLVHAAYYTDEECIARIADWIAR